METMTAYESAQEMSFVHVSVERQIRELYQYPADKPMIQFFRDYPELSFALCLKMEETILAAVRIHKNTIQWIQQVMKEKETRIEEKNGMIQERGIRIEEINAMIQEKETRIEEKNAMIQERGIRIEEIKEKMELEKCMLSAMLERANTETLKLTQNLSVRGMIEKLECQYSEKRRKEGSDASRKAVWTEILHNNGKIKEAVIKHCSGRNEACKMDAAIEAIIQIYKRASDEIHQAGYDEIPIRTSMFHGIQLEVLRGLCASTYYATREIS